MDLKVVAQEIHHLTNELRTKHSLAPLAPLEELDALATRHSQNMAEKRFFDHIDPQGHGPTERLQLFLPALLSSTSGENIAERSHEGEKNLAFAQKLMQMWQGSPEHDANLRNPHFRHLGVGLVAGSDRIYATQSFANGIALLESPWPQDLKRGDSVYLRFRFLADFPKEELGIFFYSPDAAARIPSDNGQSYIGKGPLTPNWRDSQHFTVHFLAVYGRGPYRVAMGRGNQYYQQRYTFDVD